MTQNILTENLIPNPRSSNEWSESIFQKLLNNIKRTGFMPPIIVAAHPSVKESYQILDGHLRLAVGKALDWDTLPAIVYDAPDETSVKLLLTTLNTLRGTENFRKRAELISSLAGMIPISELSTLIPEDEASITDLIALAKLDFESMEKTARKAAENDANTLPVTFNFMVKATDAVVVEMALAQMNLGSIPKGLKNRSDAFVELCKLIPVEDEYHDQAEETAE